MTEEYIYERERDLLDYFRNHLVDPINRGIVVTEPFTATALQTDFYLAQPLIKNVADTISYVRGITTTTLRKGYDYKVIYGEGKIERTKIVLTTGLQAGDILSITYLYGPSLIEREFSRSDTQLPRVVLMFLTGSEGLAALGDYMDVEGVGTQGSYFDAAYRFEIRDQYATRARKLASEVANLCKKMRHANIFRVNITRVSDMQNFDYDMEKAAYIWQLTLEIQWEVMFE
jgi:hypothetical protein